MAAEAQEWEQGGERPSRRRVPRYPVQAPLDVTVLRSGIPDTFPGRSLNLGECGLAAVLAGELQAGEAVGVEVRLPLAPDPFCARALVRHQDQLRCGLEFIGLSADQHARLRDWILRSNHWLSTTGADAGATASPVAEARKYEGDAPRQHTSPPERPKPGTRRSRGSLWTIMTAAVILVLVAFWWHWNRAWAELESGLADHDDAPVAKVQVQVPADVMQKLVIHKVDPQYPAAARQAKLQGVIALDVVVDREGSVLEVRALNGPDLLAQSAMDALRWWKFEPYRVNGEPAIVETTVAVEFRP